MSKLNLVSAILIVLVFFGLFGFFASKITLDDPSAQTVSISANADGVLHGGADIGQNLLYYILPVLKPVATNDTSATAIWHRIVFGTGTTPSGRVIVP